MESLTDQLDHIGKLLLGCTLHRPRVIQPHISVEECKRRLRICAYNSLFRLQPGPHNTTISSHKPSGFSVYEELLVAVYKLREQRFYANASRLELLISEISDQNYDFSIEVKAILQLLLLLSGTECTMSNSPVGHQPLKLPISTYGKKNKVKLPKGPLFHSDSCHLHDIQAHGYPHYSRQLFECPGTIDDAIDQTSNLNKHVFQIEPGKSLNGHNLFDIKMSGGTVEEINRRTTLYHGLIHSRTTNLDVKLDFPQLPENTIFLGLKVPVYKEMVDEGFNESMSSDVTSSTHEQVDTVNIWEAALTHKLHKKYTWEAIGSFPKPTERPYLSEAGPEAFDQLYLLRKYALTLVEPSIQMQNQIEVKQSDLVKDGLNVLLAIPSKTFHFNRETDSFYVNRNIHYKGTSAEMLTQSITSLAAAGTHYWQLSQFAKKRSLDSMYTGGLTLQAFCSGIQAFLHFYRSRVLTVPWNKQSTISMVQHAFREFTAQLKYLWMFCMCHRRKFGRPGDPGDPLPTGIQLLSYIYQEALDCCKSHNYKIMLALLRTSCGPYLMFIQDWIFNGICRDAYGEFMITANDDYLQYRDKYYWTHGFVMNTEDSTTSVPMFLQELANGMYVCGKTINLLKLCSPAHFLCNNHVPIPRLGLTYSLEELERIDKETEVYVEKMHNIVRRNTVSKEEKEARLEKAREDLLIKARKTVVDELNRIRGQMKKVKEASDEKKRKELKELKEQMQKDLVRRAMKVEEEKEADRLDVEKQDRIEKGIADIEEELERRAREELIEHYAKLTEEAIHREQHALWQIERRKLDEKRNQFLQNEQETLRKELLKLFEEMSTPPEQTKSEDSSSLSVLPQSSTDDMLTSDSDVQTVVESAPSRVEDISNSMIKNQEADKQSNRSAVSGDVTVGAENEIQDVTRVFGLASYKEDDATRPADMTDGLLDLEPGQMNLLDTSLHDFLPKPKEDEFHPPDNELDDILIEIGSELPSGRIMPEGANQVKHPSESNFIVGKEIGANTDPPPTTVTTSQGCQSTIEEILYSIRGTVDLPKRGVHGHASDTTWELTPTSSVPTSNTPSQGCQSSIEDILYSMRGKTDLPKRGAYGHASDSTLGVNSTASAIDIKAKHTPSIHGHSSDSTIAGLIHGDVAEPIKHKQRSKWGHPSSTSEIRLGLIGNTQDESEVTQKCTEDTKDDAKAVNSSDIKLASGSCHGHSSDSTIQTLLYSQEEVVTTETDLKDRQAVVSVKLPTRGIHGHSSDSSIQKVLYDGADETERKQLPPPGEIYRGRGLNVVGHPSDSSAGRIMYGETEKQTQVSSKAPQETENKEGDFSVPVTKTYMPFVDDFSQTFSLPSVDLLTNAGIVPISMELGNYGIRHGDSESNEAAHLMSLPVILRMSIITPLTAQITLVNKCILDYYIVDLNIDKYFETLRSFLFLQDGEFSQSLCDQLFEKLAQGLRPAELFTPILLNQILSKAIQHSLNRESNHADNLSFSLKWLPNMFKPNAIDSLDCLELKFKIDWPLNIVITRSCLDKYSHVFSFMLQLKRASWVLRDVYFQLKRSALLHHAGNSTQFRQLQLFRHEMQHFVNVMQGYIANQVVNVSWEEFRRQLKTDVQNLDDLHNRHAEYLNKALFRCLLNKKAAPVMKIIKDIFCLILKVRTQLVSSRWFYDPDIHQVVHPAFQTIRSSYSAFKEYSGFLYKVVSKLVTRGYQPHLEEFLLRLNFNDFYSES